MDRRGGSKDTMQTFLVISPSNIIKVFTSYQVILSGCVLHACPSGVKDGLTDLMQGVGGRGQD